MNRSIPRSLPLLACGAALLWAAAAAAQPAIIPRIGRAPHPAPETYIILKNYFADTAVSGFTLVSADPKTRTLVAKRVGIDSATWRQWAYCKMGPSNLIDSMKRAAATVNVKIDPSGNRYSYVTVNADLEGTYALGSSATTRQCVSNGVLENNILTAAGVKQS